MTEDAPRMTYPKWMNDALASDLNAEIERREAAARIEYARITDAVEEYLIRTVYPPLVERDQ